MANGQELWKVEVVVEPKLEWEKLGFDTFKVGPDASIVFEKQLENKTQFSVTLVSDDARLESGVKLLMKALLAPIELEVKRNYIIQIAHARPLQPKPTKEGWVLLDRVSFTICVIPKFEGLDLSLLKAVANSLKILGADKRERVLRALNFLHDALVASSNVQCFLLIYGGLNFLTSGVGQQTNTLLSDAMTLFDFADSRILDAGTAKAWMEKFRTFHSSHYNVLKSNRVNKQELDDIKAFFKEFLMKYLEYEKVRM